MKRGRGMGYAGIQNELYFEDNTQMLFGDAKKSLQSVIAAVNEVAKPCIRPYFRRNCPWRACIRRKYTASSDRT